MLFHFHSWDEGTKLAFDDNAPKFYRRICRKCGCQQVEQKIFLKDGGVAPAQILYRWIDINKDSETWEDGLSPKVIQG